MATTFEALATVTVGSGGAASIEFTSIPATYTDLLVKGSFRSDKTDGNDSHDVILSINSSSANQNTRYIRGDGATAYSNAETNRILRLADPSNYTANTFSNLEMYFPNYGGSSNKSFSVDSVVENNATRGDSVLVAGLWSQTAAITGLKFVVNGPSSPLFVQYSTATLYGIKNS